MAPETLIGTHLRLLALALLFVLTACTTAQQTKPAADNAAAPASVASAGGVAPASSPSQKIGPRIPGTTLTEGDYRISPLDVLDISVFQVPDLTKTVQVSSGGQISLALIGMVTAQGKTTGELEKDIANKLSVNYLQSPQVSVFVKEYTSQRITVDGAVNKPGIYPTTGQTSLVQAIALAGGLDRVADLHGIVVFRQVGGKRTAAVFDLAQIRKGKADDPTVQGGDVIVVDQSGVKAALRGVRESVGVIGLFSPVLPGL